MKKTNNSGIYLDRFVYLLEKYIGKEERELLMEIEEVLSDNELKIISDKISQSRIEN